MDALFLIVSFRYASLHNEKKHQQRGETLQLSLKVAYKSIYNLLKYFINMNTRQKSRLLFQFIVILVLITSCDKAEHQSLSFYDDYREVPIHGTVLIGPKTGSGNYTLEVQNPVLLSAEVENGWSSPSGMIAIRGLLTGKTVLTVTDNATHESQKIRIKITDNYETLRISESTLEEDVEFPPTLKNIEFIVFVNNKERDIYLINREQISLTDYVLKVRGKGNYHFTKKDDRYHLVLSYLVDGEGNPVLDETSATHVASSYMLTIPGYALHRLNQNLNLGFETSMPEQADEIVRIDGETVIQMEEAGNGYKLQGGLTLIEMPVGFM